MLLIITEVFDTNTQINTRFMTGGPEWPALCWAVPPHGCIGPNRRLRGLCSLRSDRKILLSSLSGWMFLISSIRTVRFHPSRCRLFYGTRTMGMRLLLVARSAMSLCQGARLDFCSFISGTLLNFRELVCLWWVLLWGRRGLDWIMLEVLFGEEIFVLVDHAIGIGDFFQYLNQRFICKILYFLWGYFSVWKDLFHLF